MFVVRRYWRALAAMRLSLEGNAALRGDGVAPGPEHPGLAHKLR
jgi:hypothetical protein